MPGWPVTASLWKAPVLFALVAIGVTALAYDSSVTIEARFRVLPYQSLTLSGADGETSILSVSLPAATEGDRERGYTEREGALRLHVASNVAWKIQLRLADLSSGSLEAREAGADYVELSTVPVVLARGAYGVADISVDIRRDLGAGEASSDLPVQLIATIMPE